MTAGFDIAQADLPSDLPLFPLPRVILLPRVQLPLNIFEPRYLAMTRAALSGPRLIGIVQQRPGAEGEMFATGCAGRIVSFSETDDGRYQITLKGVSRFNLGDELPKDTGGFRRARPDWAPYAADFTASIGDSGLCREAFAQTLRAYFDKRGILCERWREIKDTSCEQLISTLSVVLPFDTAEKQALLEAPDVAERARLLHCFLENEIRATADAEPCCH